MLLCQRIQGKLQSTFDAESSFSTKEIRVAVAYLQRYAVFQHELFFNPGPKTEQKLGSAFGVYEHIEENIAFAREIRPVATFGDVWLEGFRGANPLLAPGLLALAAVLGFAGTYGHHALGATSGDEVR